MLHTILGRAGAGKTQYLHALLRDAVLAGKRDLLLLVPEQDSFAHEKALLQLLGERHAVAVEVLSFSRLANALFRTCGHPTGRPLSDSLSAIAMLLALETTQSRLQYYTHTNEHWVPALLQFRKELSMSAIEPLTLLQAANRLSDPKLADLAQIASVYDSIATKEFDGCGDRLQFLADCLKTEPGRSFFKGRWLAIDSFWGFTHLENKILGRILPAVEECYVSLCCNGLQPLAPADPFAHTRRTLRELHALAKAAGVPIAKPMQLPTNGASLRFASPALAKLEDLLATDAPPAKAHTHAALTLCSCNDMEDECNDAARRIRRLLREQNLRCREIAVIARDASYQPVLSAALQRVGVPVFEDQRLQVAGQPLMRLFAAAVQIASEGFVPDAMHRLLKTGLCPLTEAEVFALENYVLLWEIKADDWLSPWTMHPLGFGDFSHNEHSMRQLQRLNHLRVALTDPLQTLRSALQHTTGASAAKALDAFLQSLRVPHALRQQREHLLQNQCPAAALELARVWDLSMHMLDELSTALGTQPMSAKRFATFVRLCIQTHALGELPQSLDAVVFGVADRIRFATGDAAPKAVFLLGLAESLFPKTPSESPLMHDADRLKLQGLGVQMQDSTAAQLDMEQLVLYKAFTSASHWLHCSWSLRNAAGDDLRPSPMVGWLLQRFCDLTHEQTRLLSPLQRLEDTSSGFALLCEDKSQQTPSHLGVALQTYFAAAPNYSTKLAMLDRFCGATPANFRIQNSQVAGALWSQHLHISPSQIETYAKCPFQHFAKHGLQLAPRASTAYDARLRGSTLHTLLELIFRDRPVDAWLALQKHERAHAFAEAIAPYATSITNLPLLPARTLFLFRRACENALVIAERILEDFLQSQFRPTDFELRIAPDAAVQPYTIPFGNNTLHICGRVDRVDTVTLGAQTYFRVIDYKTGSKSFELGEVFLGLNLQMLLYLLALWRDASHGLPAGMLYTQARDPVLKSTDRHLSEEQILQLKQENTRADGMIVAQNDIIFAMEAEAAGRFIPAKITQNEPEKNVIPLPLLQKLATQVESIVTQMASQMQQGHIEAMPLCNSKTNPCAHCPFRPVCGHEPGDPQRNLQVLKFSEALEFLQRMEPTDGLDP